MPFVQAGFRPRRRLPNLNRSLISLLIAMCLLYFMYGHSRDSSIDDSGYTVTGRSQNRRTLLQESTNDEDPIPEKVKDQNEPLPESTESGQILENGEKDVTIKLRTTSTLEPTLKLSPVVKPTPAETTITNNRITSIPFKSTTSAAEAKHSEHKTTETTRKPVLVNSTQSYIGKDGMEDCTPAAYHEFPPDLFGQYARAHGAVIVHMLVVMYMFYAVAVVCDDYFIASLDECCSRLNLSQDVAGATFMAAGSSAPELFTAILGVLVAKGDVGTGTIVGSAVFNVLFVIGLCGIFAGRVVVLNWWPLFRDSIYYAFTVIVLIIIIYDSEVTWYESLIMLCFYVLYIIIMKYNSAIHRGVALVFHIHEEEVPAVMGILSQNTDNKCYSSYVAFNNEIDDHAQTPVTSQIQIAPDESCKMATRRLTFFEAAQLILMSRYFPPLTRFRAACRRIICEQQKLRQNSSKLPSQISVDPTDLLHHRRSISVALTSDDLSWKRIPSLHEGVLHLIKWVITYPVLITLHYTIPDCKRSDNRKWFLLTFFMSITWTAVFSYVMVWMVVLIGFTMGIPDSIMGITFLAAGTSVPDAFASLVVARQGQGDMAVSNSIGSNVFDILIGLALPWFIQTTMVDPGSTSIINSRGMVYAVVLLFLTIIITIAGVHFSGWQLTPKLGIILIIIYFIFLTAACMLEFNVLGYVNPPMCLE